MADAHTTRVVIVGSGVSGALLAERLLARGLGPITMLEAGGAVAMADQRHWLDFVMAGRLPYDDAGDRDKDFESDGAQPWKIQGGRLIARGGSTLHWGGWCPRLKPEDFEMHSRVGSGGLDWPLSYHDLEPYYELAEHHLQVSGDSSDQDPPRKKPYPFEAAPFSRNDGRMIDAMIELGISHMHMPVARNVKPINGQAQCLTTGTCDYCPLGARFTGDQPLDRLQRAHAEGDFSLLLGAPARRVLLEGKKRARGVEYSDLASGETRVIEAEVVILAAGALEIPKLLLASRSPEWPDGIGNDGDQVGRHIIANPYFYFRAGADDNPDQLQEELHFVTLSSRHWDSPDQQREGKFLLSRSYERPDLKLADAMAEGHTSARLRGLIRGPHTIEIVGTIQTFCHAENRVTPARGETRFGLPRTRISTPRIGFSPQQEATVLGRMQRIAETMGYTAIPGAGGRGAYPQRGDHAMCTAQMSPSPATGVVDADLRVHGTDNLYILSNAVFPSGAAANPTLTLAALGFRLAETLGAE